jgi:hypothetical protein
MKIKTTFLFMVLALFLTGCGYRIGFMGHPQISSLAVAPVTNETLIYNAAGNLRALLCERIVTDGTYKLLSESKADCILTARVVSAEFSQVSWSSSNDDEEEFLPEYYRVNVKVEYSVILPGRVKPLIGPDSVTGTAMFDHVVDLETARRNGVKQALWDASKKIVDACAEAW